MNLTNVHAWLAIPILVIALVITACGGATSPKATPAGSSAAPAPIAQGAATKQTPTRAQPSTTTSNADCLAIGKANLDFGTTMPKLINLTADTNYSAYTDQGSPFYVDFPKTRKDLDSLALLPDPTDAVELTFGKPSDSVAYFREVVDVAESDVKSEGKPFQDTGASGRKVIGFETAWGTEYSSFALAMDKACPNFQFPIETAVPSQASFQIGQTAPLGDLRVTLDKMTTISGQAGNLPETGMRFLVLYLTVQNTGKTPLTTLALAVSTLTDAAGNVYGFNPNALYASTITSGGDLNGELAGGAKESGKVAYTLPIDAGDLVWTVKDSADHQDRFAIKASEISQEGVLITAPTADALNTSVAATRDALIQMSNDADVTDAALTAVPVTDGPNATEEPTGTEEPTATDEPTETPG